MAAASSGFTDAQIVDYIIQHKNHLPAPFKQHQSYLTTLASFGNADSIKQKISAYENDYQTNETIISVSKKIAAEAEYKNNVHSVAASLVAIPAFLGTAALIDSYAIPERTAFISIGAGLSIGWLVKKGLDTVFNAYTEKELQQIKDESAMLEQQQKSQSSFRSALQALHDNNAVFLENNGEAVDHAEQIVLSEINQRRPPALAF